MKKIFGLSLLVLMLAGCAESQVKQETENIIKNDYKEVLSESVTKSVKDEVGEIQEDLYNIVLEPLNLKGEKVDLESVKGYDDVMNKFNKLKSQTEYEFTEVEILDDTAKVELETKYPDAGPAIEKAVSESMEKAALKLYSDEKLTKKEYLEGLFKAINEELDGVEIDKATNKKAKLELVKEDNWKIAKLNESALDALSLNLTKQRDLIGKKAGETKQNIFFMETEANLQDVFEASKKVVLKDKIPLKKLKTKHIAKAVEKRTKLKAAVVKKAGTKEDFYYIIKGHNKLSVIVNRDGEQFKFSDKLK